jgi:YHS domain-containing protein
MDVNPEHAAAHRSYDGTTHFFCGIGCADQFDKDPSRYAVGGAAADRPHVRG